MGVEHCVHILDWSNSFLRLYTPLPSPVFLTVTNSVCLELFPQWFLCYSPVSIHSYFIKLHWKVKEIRTSEVKYPWPQLNTAYFFRDDKRFPYRVRDSLPHLKIYIIIQILKKLSHLYKSYFLKYNSRYFSHFSIYKSLWNSRLCHLDSKSKMNVRNQKHFVWSSEFYSSFVFLSSFLHEIGDYSNVKVFFWRPFTIYLISLMDSTVHGILQARILKWVAFPFSRGSSQPRNRTQVSHIAGGFFTSWATREAQQYWSG